MKKMRIIVNIALIVFFGAMIPNFAENVRTVQIIGLLACGGVIGANFTAMMIYLFKPKWTKE